MIPDGVLDFDMAQEQLDRPQIAGQDTGNGYALSGISKDSVAEITNWYKEKLKDWKIVSETTFETDEGKSINLAVTKGEMDMTIMIIDTEEGAGVNQTIGE